MTANPALNLSQQAVALVCDVQSKDGAVPEEIRVSWQMLLRQIVQEDILTGMESAFEVRVNFFHTASFESLLCVLWNAAPSSPYGCSIKHVFGHVRWHQC